MKKTMLRFGLFAVGCLAVLGLTFVMVTPKSDLITNAGATLRLQAPVFVGEVQAQNAGEAFDLGAYLDQEAGISAYFKSAFPITISQVRPAFRTVETETADYIIGSVAVTNYVENFDAHAYVHKDGWIMAYYLRGDPTSKIIDVKGHTISSTNLKTVAAAVASAAGAPFTDVTYYDFRYPNATNLLLVAEQGDNGNSFTITIPSTYAYFERSWSHRYYCEMRFDGTDSPNQVYSGDNMCYGTLTASQLLPDVAHTIKTRGNGEDYGVLAITYRVP